MDRNKRTMVKQEYNARSKTILPPTLKQWNETAKHSYAYYERPMMLNAWTQTCAEDFDKVLQDDDVTRKHALQSQIEKSLLAKIKILEENVREHTELLSEIHENYASKEVACTKSESSYPQKDHRRDESNANSMYGESVNYRIIADGTMNQHSDPIEIQLADSEGGLNNSADSGRLTICLTEDSINISEENRHNVSSDVDGASVQKRQKIQRETRNHLMSASGGEARFVANNQTNGYVHEINAKNVSPRQNSSVVKVHKDSPYPQEKRLQSDCDTPKMDRDTVMVSIGPNNTMIPARVYEDMNWTQASIATRKLLMTIFDRETLATHSMTGKPSPAFKDQMKPLKQMLNPMIIQDIIFAVTHKCNATEKEVRNAITTKCADENKMMKLQMNKKRKLRELNKENEGDFI